MDKLLKIRDYLYTMFGCHFAVPRASLTVSKWLRTQYPALSNSQLLTLTAVLIQMTLNGLSVSETAKQQLDVAVSKILLIKE